MANNRELSQLASFVTVNDTSKTIAFGSTVASLNVAGVVTATTFVGDLNGNITGSSAGVNVTGVGTITRLEVTDINVSGASTIGVVTAINISGTNVAIGSDASSRISNGVRNILIGHETGESVTTAEDVTFIGWCAGYSNTNGNDNIFMGKRAGFSNTGGCQNIFMGVSAGFANTIGIDNIAMGARAGYALSTGDCNVFIGQYAGCSGNSSGNVMIGRQTGRAYTGTGGCNVFLGSLAGRFALTGCENVALGRNAGFNLGSGVRNVFLGTNAGFGTDAAAGLTGSSNVALGENTLYFLESGSFNIALGYCPGNGLTSGSCNIMIGQYAGRCATTGNNNIVLGTNAGQDAVFTFNTAGTAGTSNVIVMGNNDHTKSYIKIDWTVTSDERDKNVIGEVPLGLQFVQGLEPIKFQFKDRETGKVTDDTLRYGFKAQQVAELEGEPHVIADMEDPDHLKVTSAHLVPVLVNAIKELSAKVAELEARLDAQ